MASRIIKTLQDAQAAINELQDWKDKLATASWDFHGLRITNAGPSKDANDYVIRSELTAPPPAIGSSNDVYTAVFTSDAPTDSDILPAYIAGTNRDGTIIQVWCRTKGPPSGGNFSIDPSINNTKLLTTPLIVPSGSALTAVSNAFISPLPAIGYLTEISGIVNTASSATLVTMGVVVRRNK